MQDPRLPSFAENLNPNPRKKNVSSSRTPMAHLSGNDVGEVPQMHWPLPSKKQVKASKRNPKNDDLMSYPQLERSSSESLPDSSTSGDEYRQLRRKYLLLEEESLALGNELKGVEVEVNALEAEKNALLDQLVVLEGLVDPAEIQNPR